MATRGYTETFADYTGGRETTAELVMMIGVSGSGKSTVAMSRVNAGRGQTVRLNRDSMRRMIYVDVDYPAHKDVEIRKLELSMARTLLKAGKTVIIDDTNCAARSRAMWEQLARQERVKLRRVRFNVSLEDCIARDATRQGRQRVGKDIIVRQAKDLAKADDIVKDEPLTRPVWERQQLLEGQWIPRLPGAKWVLVDIDGTMADHTDVRHAYDEERVGLDNPYPVVIEWVRALYQHYNVLIISGRKTKCGNETCDWLDMHAVPFDHILMRPWKDSRKDAIVKKEILDDLMSVFLPEDIAFILDDRPQVVRMWRDESETPEARHHYGRFTVYPVRGALEEF